MFSIPAVSQSFEQDRQMFALHMHVHAQAGQPVLISDKVLPTASDISSAVFHNTYYQSKATCHMHFSWPYLFVVLSER